MAAVADSQNSSISATPSNKHVVDDLNAILSTRKFSNDPTALTCDTLPVIDFAALFADDPDQRFKSINHLAKACEEWGFFILVNHGIGEDLMSAIFSETKEFVNLRDDEKEQYYDKDGRAPISCGNLNCSPKSGVNFNFWREYLKLQVHPEFHCPNKPQSLREVVREYAEKMGELTRKLFGAVSESLELEQEYVGGALGLESSAQVFAANYYPACPEPDQAIGLPPHTDYGLLTLLIHNGVAGLQIQHNDHWFHVHSPTDSILVNVGDQLQCFSNGRYKSVKHRAVLNEQNERVSIAFLYGQSKETMVAPAAHLLERDSHANYASINYQDFIDQKFKNNRKSFAMAVK